jgi:hypothetical protein
MPRLLLQVSFSQASTWAPIGASSTNTVSCAKHPPPTAAGAAAAAAAVVAVVVFVEQQQQASLLQQQLHIRGCQSRQHAVGDRDL